WGRIVTLSSVGGLRGGPQLAHYAAAKAGVIGFTKALALEVGSHGVTANAVAPGLVDTPMLRGSGMPADMLEQSRRQIPVGRLGTPDDIAAACAFLVSEEAGFVTGQGLSPNGGGWLWPSGPAKDRAALLEEGPYSFGVVGALEAGGNESGDGRGVARLRGTLGLQDGALRRAQRERRVGGDVRSVALGERLQLRARHGPVHQTDAQRLGGGVPAGGGEDLRRRRRPQHADPAVHPALVVAEPPGGPRRRARR